MALTGNTFGAEVFKEDWETKLQERLDKNTIWKEVCKVVYTNTKILHNPYMTDATVQTGTRDQAYTHQAVVMTDDDVTIDTFKILPQYIDRADLAQCTYADQMDLADSQGVLLNEALEAALYANHAEYTDFDNASIGGGAGNITVSATNIDDIIRGIKREIREANGDKMLARNGGFIVWRPADFEILEAFVQANGFSTADGALKDGTNNGFRYMGMEHYASNLLTGGHLLGGVKKAITIGICKSTYGQVIIDNEPATAEGAVSAVAVISRVDFKYKTWTKNVPITFDILVA